MAKPLRGEVEVELAGDKYTLRIGIGEIEEIESSANMGILAIARSMFTEEVRYTHVRIVLSQAMLINGKKAPLAKVVAVMTDAGVVSSRNAAIKVLSAALLDPIEGNADAPDQQTETSATGAQT